MPEIYISEEINNNKFNVSGGVSGKKVSWVVYAERNDKYLQTFPNLRNVEVPKTETEKGKYLDYKAWKQPESKAFFKLKNHKMKSKDKSNKNTERKKIDN